MADLYIEIANSLFVGFKKVEETQISGPKVLGCNHPGRCVQYCRMRTW